MCICTSKKEKNCLKPRRLGANCFDPYKETPGESAGFRLLKGGWGQLKGRLLKDKYPPLVIYEENPCCPYEQGPLRFTTRAWAPPISQPPPSVAKISAGIL
jgi:hypothetical protein